MLKIAFHELDGGLEIVRVTEQDITEIGLVFDEVVEVLPELILLTIVECIDGCPEFGPGVLHGVDDGCGINGTTSSLASCFHFEFTKRHFLFFWN